MNKTIVPAHAHYKQIDIISLYSINQINILVRVAQTNTSISTRINKNLLVSYISLCDEEYFTQENECGKCFMIFGCFFKNSYSHFMQ